MTHGRTEFTLTRPHILRLSLVALFARRELLQWKQGIDPRGNPVKARRSEKGESPFQVKLIE